MLLVVVVVIAGFEDPDRGPLAMAAPAVVDAVEEEGEAEEEEEGGAGSGAGYCADVQRVRFVGGGGSGRWGVGWW